MGALNPSRRGMLAAIGAAPVAAVAAGAVSSPVDPDLWGKRLGRLTLLRALMEADDVFGQNAKANAAWDSFKHEMKQTHGTDKKWKAPPETHDRWQAEFTRMNVASSEFFAKYVEPLDQAAIDLVRTPAPDAEAVAFKVDLIKELELWNSATMPEDCMDLIRADTMRLMKGLI